MQSVKEKTKQTAAIIKRVFVDPLASAGVIPLPSRADLGILSRHRIRLALRAQHFHPVHLLQGTVHGFPTVLLGLLYLAPSLGYALASLIGGRWIDGIMAREARKAQRYDASGKLHTFRKIG